MKRKGILFVVSAPSGAGKGTVLKRLFKKDDNLRFSVSLTTRPIRKGEIDGRNYNFITKDEFNDLREEDNLIEWTEYCGNYYGTPKAAVEKNLILGYDTILEIEVEGAGNIRNIYPDCVMIFILPPSMEELERRIRKRGTEDDVKIRERIETAKKEIQRSIMYDYIVINDRIEKAVYDLECIINAERHRTHRYKDLEII